MWVGVAWAFGWRVMCVALIYWGTNVPGAGREFAAKHAATPLTNHMGLRTVVAFEPLHAGLTLRTARARGGSLRCGRTRGTASLPSDAGSSPR
jgi:hypothetical protein